MCGVRRRGEGGFRGAGSFDAEAAGLPKPLAKKLELIRAWRSVAGPILADRARAVQIVRGVVELAVEDPAWARQVVPLLPLLAARLTRAAPTLGIRKFRVTVGGEVRIPPTAPPEVNEHPATAGPAPPLASSAAIPDLPSEGDPEARISDLARRYLAAARRRTRG